MCRCVIGAQCEQCVQGRMTFDCHGRGYCDLEGTTPKCVCFYKNYDPETHCRNSLCKGLCLNGGKIPVLGFVLSPLGSFDCRVTLIIVQF